MPELLNSIIARIGDTASVKSIYGEQISAHGRTIIPVARVACGFGGGAGKRHQSEHEGEGGGGGLVALPVGVFEVSEAGTRFVPLHDKRKIATVGIASFCLGMILSAMRRKR
ncbi:MAG: hypothetical protein QOJ99_5384 [Bryobacterales bacterium]|nr:hypothetical protein [Bryobacterales bacterium]